MSGEVVAAIKAEFLGPSIAIGTISGIFQVTLRMQGSRFAFGPFVLDPGAGMLLRNDDPVAVDHRGLELLAALVRRPGEILGNAELMDAALPGTAVEEGNLTVQGAAADYG